MKNIISESLASSISYENYRQIIKDALADGKTTGHIQSDEMTHYTLLNETRMDRLQKTMKVSDDIKLKLEALEKEYIWLVISEGWCGDAAQLVPIFNKMEMASEKIEMKLVFRDENEELMNLFLTDGSKSIPILIVLEKHSQKVLAHWGPRPKDAADLIKRRKLEKGFIDEEAKTELQLWYLHDKGVSTQNEIMEMMLAVDKAN